MSVSRFALIMALAFFFGLAYTQFGTSFEIAYWIGDELEELSEDGSWLPSTRNQIGDEDRIQQIRFRVEIDTSDKWSQPIGLYVGGPFSANIYWDGGQIGEKGRAGLSEDLEIPGPIDSISFVPPHLLEPGTHEIRLEISTQHLLSRDVSVVHTVVLGPYRGDGRRELRYYAAPLIILSALIALVIQNFRIGGSAGDPMYFGLGLFGLFMIISLLSEVSRALVNYPYHYHELRGLLGWIGNIGVGLSLIYTVFRLREEQWVKVILLLGIVGLGLSYLIPENSGDYRLARDFLYLTFAPSLVFAVLAYRKQYSFLTMLPLFWVACFISTQISVGLFLDSYQFIAALILLLGAWQWTNVSHIDSPPNSEKVSGLELFEVKSSGKEQLIKVSDVYALKSEGNFTAILMNDGSSALHQDGLGKVMQSDPEGFTRVHRSYAVNTKQAKTLRSAEGSKYWLEMENGEDIPVSRYRVAELRGLLAS